jgi:hypothetical protein
LSRFAPQKLAVAHSLFRPSLPPAHLLHPLLIREFLSQSKSGKSVRSWEQPPEQRHVNQILNATEVKAAEACEGGVTTPVYFIALLDCRLDEEIGEGGFEG